MLRRVAGTLLLTLLVVLPLACSRSQRAPAKTNDSEQTGVVKVENLVATSAVASSVGEAPKPPPSAVASNVRAASELLPEAGVPPKSSGSASPPKSAGKSNGSSCTNSSECRAGMSCCQTGFRGHCGGAFLPDAPPCVFLSTCAPSPCPPLKLPP